MEEVLIIIILFITIFDKIKLTSKYLRVLNNNYNQYEAFNYLKDSEKQTLIITPALYRENIIDDPTIIRIIKIRIDLIRACLLVYSLTLYGISFMVVLYRDSVIYKNINQL